jgi:predicted XRE-type DNA-binding protein
MLQQPVQEICLFGQINQEKQSQQQAIGVVDVYIEKNPEFIELMNGHYARFTAHELWTIMTNLTELNINTLQTQQLIDGTFFCKVDKHTVKYYQERNQI